MTLVLIQDWKQGQANPGSKPQRFGVKNCKSSTSDKLQTFNTIFGIYCKMLTIMSKHFLFCFQMQQLQLLGVFSLREITEQFRKQKTRINDLRHFRVPL
jgi:hypothetical protein